MEFVGVREAKPMEVRSDRTPQPARILFLLNLAAPAGLGLSLTTMVKRSDPFLRMRLRRRLF